MIVGAQIFVSVEHVSADLLRGFAGLFLGLSDGVASSRDFALIAIENRQRNVEGQCSGAESGGMRVSGAGGQILLAVGDSQGFLASRGGDVCCAAIDQGRDWPYSSDRSGRHFPAIIEIA